MRLTDLLVWRVKREPFLNSTDRFRWRNGFAHERARAVAFEKTFFAFRRANQDEFVARFEFRRGIGIDLQTFFGAQRDDVALRLTRNSSLGERFSGEHRRNFRFRHMQPFGDHQNVRALEEIENRRRAHRGIGQNEISAGAMQRGNVPLAS